MKLQPKKDKSMGGLCKVLEVSSGANYELSWKPLRNDWSRKDFSTHNMSGRVIKTFDLGTPA